MLMLIPDQGVTDWLTDLIAGVDVLASMYLALFRLDLQINRYTVLSDLLSAECSFPNYSRVHLTNWTSPVLVSAFLAYTQPKVPEFKAISDIPPIYGVFVTNNSNDRLYMTGKFDAPITLHNSQYLYLEVTLALGSMVTN
jgi:hypothetical protein